MSVCSLRVSGRVECDYDYVSFNVSVFANAKTGSLALDNLKVSVEELNKVLAQLTKNGLAIAKDSLQTNTNVSPHQVYNNSKGTYERKGFNATYTLSFGTFDLTKVNEVFDTLVQVPEASVDSPVFDLKKVEWNALREEALTKAKAELDNRLARECRLFDVDQKDLRISGWNITYSNANEYEESAIGGTRTMAMAAAPAMNHVQRVNIVSGKATVSASLNVSYDWKNK